VGGTYTADTVCDGNQRCSFRPRPGDDGGFPCDLDVQANERSSAQEEDGEVARRNVESRDHDHGSDQTDKDGADDVEAVFETTSARP